MNKGQIVLTLTLGMFVASVAWAQDQQSQPAAPVPAFGQDNPAPAVTENPPISAIDQPGLEPHAAPESFLLPGLHFSESVDSNVQDELGGSSAGSVTRGLGSLTLQKLWKNYDVAMDYIGGVAYSNNSNIGVEQLQQFDMDNRINWKRGQLAIRDSFSYLPDGYFGYSAYGGEGAYSSGLGSLGAGLLGASAFGGQASAFISGSGLSVGQSPRLTNVGLVDVVEDLTPKSSVTMAAGYGLVHFYGDILANGGTEENVYFLGSSEYTAQVAYDRVLNPKDQVAISYGYQAFDFSIADTAFQSNVIQVLYGHRISGRMDFLIGAGPQFTHISDSGTVCNDPFATSEDCTEMGGMFVPVSEKANKIGVAGRMSLRYKFPKTSLSLSFQRYNTDGAGVFAGSESNIAHLDLRRPLTRVWDIFADLGYSKDARLQLAGSAVDANNYSYGFGGVGLHRQFGRSLRGFVSYQFNESGFDTACPVGASPSGACSNRSQRQVGSIGVDWTPRPIRLD
jgi:hypothetical protein